MKAILAYIVGLKAAVGYVSWNELWAAVMAPAWQVRRCQADVKSGLARAVVGSAHAS